MKHAAVKVKDTEKVLSKAKIGSAKNERKISNPKAIKLAKNTTAKGEKKPIVPAFPGKKPQGKSAESVVVAFPKLKSKATKSVPIVSEKKVQRKKDVSVISPKQIKAKKSATNVSAKSKAAVAKLKISQQAAKRQSVSAPKKKSVSAPSEKSIIKKKFQAKKASPVISDVKLKSKNQKTSSFVSVAKPKPKKEKIVPVLAVQEIKRTKKTAKVLPTVKAETKTAKNKLFLAINKISVIKKQPSLPDEKANLNLPFTAPEATPVEPASATKPTPQKSKAKNKKPIGAAVFRGKKERYDFQVYPIDAEFENVSAIYVISKRKIDQQKRGHHALVCIGQTDSILGEIKKHKSKCIKKHNANVISILPEANEKKRLKIEEDLKAAHAIACDI